MDVWVIFGHDGATRAPTVGRPQDGANSGSGGATLLISEHMLRPIKRFLLRTRRSVRAPHLALGSYGEAQALEYLKGTGQYSIVATNFRIPLGRGASGRKINAEIDIIAYDGKTLVFVEVKTRSSEEFVPAHRAVDLQKQRQISRAAHRYRHVMKVLDEPYRYDVVTVVTGPSGAKVELFRGYFDDSVFHRGRYFMQYGSGNPPSF